MRATFILAFAAPVLQLLALPAPAEPPREAAQLESVTVEAERRRERVDREISEYVYSVVGSAQVESLARWKVPVCPAAFGLTDAEAGFVAQRIAQAVTDAAVPLGRPGCVANFIVVVTADPAELLKDWWADDHRLFNRDRGLGAVNRMIRTDEPVRTWHNACNVPPLRGHYQPSGELNCNTGVTGSRLVHSAVRAIYSAIIVVDIARIEGLTFGQLADYVAMVGLVKVRRDPGLGTAPTILGLFGRSDLERPTGLTDWDRSFLDAVYETTDGSVTEIAQIKLRMSESLAIQ